MDVWINYHKIHENVSSTICYRLAASKTIFNLPITKIDKKNFTGPKRSLTSATSEIFHTQTQKHPVTL